MNNKPTFNLRKRVNYTLPLSPAPAVRMQDGGGTEGEKLARLLNPKNWFVKDYTKSGDFNTAFRDAKMAGEEEFIWNNKRYSTKSNLSEEAQMKSYGITDEQRKLTPSGSDRFLYEPIKNALENISKIDTGPGYAIPIKNLALASLGKNSLLPLTQGQGLDWEKNNVYLDEGLPRFMFADYSDYPNAPGAKEQDALRLYLGLPQRYQSFKPSKYKKGAFEIVGYNKELSKIMPSDEYIKTFGHWSFPGGPNEEFAIKPYADLVMGKHTVKKGKDERGEYIEYSDKFDFDTYGLVGDIADRLNKPFEIYGRKYYKDYGDGVKREMFYSDKELMSLDPKKKNFDTLALQEELYKRGYSLQGSVTKDGDLDGILGEETINALLDWQSKNKRQVSKKEDGGIINNQYYNIQKMKRILRSRKTLQKFQQGGMPQTEQQSPASWQGVTQPDDRMTSVVRNPIMQRTLGNMGVVFDQDGYMAFTDGKEMFIFDDPTESGITPEYVSSLDENDLGNLFLQLNSIVLNQKKDVEAMQNRSYEDYTNPKRSMVAPTFEQWFNMVGEMIREEQPGVTREELQEYYQEDLNAYNANSMSPELLKKTKGNPEMLRNYYESSKQTLPFYYIEPNEIQMNQGNQSPRRYKNGGYGTSYFKDIAKSIK